jgi:hypothetical protein
MSGDMTMIPSLSDRLGRQGYTIVARAPGVGLPQLADGSWHVVGGSDPTLPEQMHDFDQNLIPFILSKGGDIVLYRLSDDPMGMAKPVLSRGGMSGRPPQLATVHSFDPSILAGLSELHALGLAPVVAPLAPKAEPRYDRRVLAGIAAVFTLLIGSTAYVVVPKLLPTPPGRWVPDMNDPRQAALAKGATVMAMPSTKNPDVMVLYRIYPSADGKERRENVGSFKKRDLENWEGELPDSRVEWRRDF